MLLHLQLSKTCFCAFEFFISKTSPHGQYCLAIEHLPQTWVWPIGTKHQIVKIIFGVLTLQGKLLVKSLIWLFKQYFRKNSRMNFLTNKYTPKLKICFGFATYSNQNMLLKCAYWLNKSCALKQLFATTNPICICPKIHVLVSFELFYRQNITHCIILALIEKCSQANQNDFAQSANTSNSKNHLVILTFSTVKTRTCKNLCNIGLFHKSTRESGYIGINYKLPNRKYFSLLLNFFISQKSRFGAFTFIWKHRAAW